MNVILLVTDTFRHDNLSCYASHARASTPCLDAFAQHAHVFENAYVGSFPTLPFRLDIMSGRFSFIDHEWGPLPKETVTTQQLLSDSGIVTELIFDNNHLVERGFNYVRGFDGFEWIRGQSSDHWMTAPKVVAMPSGQKNYPIEMLRRYLRNTSCWTQEEDHFAPRVIRTACHWLEENHDQHFFLHLELFDPHEPWDAPRIYVQMYDRDYEGEWILKPYYGRWRDYYNAREMQHIYAEYLAEVTMVDHWFGVLLDKLDELGRSRDTAVIFVGDHGFLFGEHDLIGKSLHRITPSGEDKIQSLPLYNELRRIPLLIRLPGSRSHSRISALVQAPDLMPTILEIAGLPIPEPHAAPIAREALQHGVSPASDVRFELANVHGKSLVGLMSCETTHHRDLVVCSNSILNHTPLMARSAVVTSDGWCLHYAGNYDRGDRYVTASMAGRIDEEESHTPTIPELYYLPDDPCESKNLIESNHALACDIHERYVAWLREVGTPEEHLRGRRRLE